MQGLHMKLRFTVLGGRKYIEAPEPSTILSTPAYKQRCSRRKHLLLGIRCFGAAV
jgi:hypothetical protein